MIFWDRRRDCPFCGAFDGMIQEKDEYGSWYTCLGCFRSIPTEEQREKQLVG